MKNYLLAAFLGLYPLQVQAQATSSTASVDWLEDFEKEKPAPKLPDSWYQSPWFWGSISAVMVGVSVGTILILQGGQRSFCIPVDGDSGGC